MHNFVYRRILPAKIFFLRKDYTFFAFIISHQKIQLFPLHSIASFFTKMLLKHTSADPFTLHKRNFFFLYLLILYKSYTFSFFDSEPSSYVRSLPRLRLHVTITLFYVL